MKPAPPPLLLLSTVKLGVPMDKVYPMDVERAFRAMDRIKPHVNVWWTTGAQPAQLLAEPDDLLPRGRSRGGTMRNHCAVELLGAGARLLLSYIPLEFYYAKPFQRPGTGWVFGFNIIPGW